MLCVLLLTQDLSAADLFKNVACLDIQWFWLLCGMLMV